MRVKKIFSAILIFSLFVSCASTKKNSANPYEEKNPVTTENFFRGEEFIRLTFAGDIMAHRENAADFKNAYDDIKQILLWADFSFCNLETSVDDKKNFSSYPLFNVKENFAETLIQSGFNVFSLANNHCNDFGAEGLDATLNFFSRKKSELSESGRKIYFSGIKQNENDGMKFVLMEKNGWKILFASVTEVLNFRTDTQKFNYVSPAEISRKKFLEQVKTQKENSGCDILVLSLHCNESEYVRGIDENQKKFYHALVDSGVDILWINHPHVSKEWEIIPDENKNPAKMIFYSVGNTISGQRRNPNFKNPQENHEYTGDSFITQIILKKENGSAKIVWVNPVMITTFITAGNQFVIKKLDDSFLQELRSEKNFVWFDYLSERKKLMEQIKGKISCR
jgi:poly-gamma-glutamate synthesis protein (capsule biosynthesis protein)